MSVACFTKHLLRFTAFKPMGKRARPSVRTLSARELRYLMHSRARETPIYRVSSCYRDIHTTNSAMVAKIMTADEMFSRKSLQDYLRTLETEYNECLRAVNTADLQADDEEDVRAKRTRMTALGPLVQKIRELEAKRSEFEETESLLKGRNGPSVTFGCQVRAEAVLPGCQLSLPRKRPRPARACRDGEGALPGEHPRNETNGRSPSRHKLISSYQRLLQRCNMLEHRAKALGAWSLSHAVSWNTWTTVHACNYPAQCMRSSRCRSGISVHVHIRHQSGERVISLPWRGSWCLMGRCENFRTRESLEFKPNGANDIYTGGVRKRWLSSLTCAQWAGTWQVICYCSSSAFGVSWRSFLWHFIYIYTYTSRRGMCPELCFGCWKSLILFLFFFFFNSYRSSLFSSPKKNQTWVIWS